jgi:hypothetical protein
VGTGGIGINQNGRNVRRGRKPRYRDERDRREHKDGITRRDVLRADEMIAAYGPDGYERVREVGRRYDPGDIFGHAGVRL